MGYAEAKEVYKTKYGKTLRNSWIAHVLDIHGKTTRGHLVGMAITNTRVLNPLNLILKMS